MASAVVYDGKALTYGGALYVGETCPPCCCLPGACCVPTGKWHCEAGDAYKHPKSVKFAQMVFSGFPASMRFYKYYYSEIWDTSWNGSCVQRIREEYEDETITGLDALNGTHVAQLLNDGGTGACDHAAGDYAEGSCAIHNSTCRWWVKVPAPQLSRTYRWYSSDSGAVPGGSPTVEDFQGTLGGWFRFTLNNATGKLEVIMEFDGVEFDGFQQSHHRTIRIFTDGLDTGSPSSVPRTVPQPADHAGPYPLRESYCYDPAVDMPNRVWTLSYSGLSEGIKDDNTPNYDTETTSVSSTGCGNNYEHKIKTYPVFDARVEFEYSL